MQKHAPQKALWKVPGAVYDEYLLHKRLRLVAFGPDYFGQEQDWTFKHFQTQGDGEKNKKTSIGTYLPRIASALEIREILVPSPVEFNARMCRPEVLVTKIPLKDNGHRVTLKRGANGSGRADGIILPPHQTYGISVAGCPFLILWHEPSGQLGIGHAGRKSVINEDWLEGKIDARADESIVDTLLRAMGCSQNGKSAAMQAIIAFPIDARDLTYPWDHGLFGVLNKRRSDHVLRKWGETCLPDFGRPLAEHLGRIDLAWILRRQLMNHGVPLERVTTIHAPESWYTTRGEHPGRRNLVLLKRFF
jgi:hypothetical protein